MTAVTVKTDETYARTRKASGIADALSTVGVTDAREVADTSWALASQVGGHRASRPSEITKAAVTAMLDVEHGRLNLRPSGSGDACKTYYATRKAYRIACILWEVGMEDAREASAMQWREARLIAGVEAPSEFTRTVVEGLLDHRREALT